MRKVMIDGTFTEPIQISNSTINDATGVAFITVIKGRVRSRSRETRWVMIASTTPIAVALKMPESTFQIERPVIL